MKRKKTTDISEEEEKEANHDKFIKRMPLYLKEKCILWRACYLWSGSYFSTLVATKKLNVSISNSHTFNGDVRNHESTDIDFSSFVSLFQTYESGDVTKISSNPFYKTGLQFYLAQHPIYCRIEEGEGKVKLELSELMKGKLLMSNMIWYLICHDMI